MGQGIGSAACGDAQIPCFDCCDVEGQRNQRRMPQTLRTLREPGYDVELAVSPLAGLKGAAGYHSSVLVASEEYWFSTLGIMHSPNISSHKKNPQMQRIFVGLSKYSGADLVEFFDHHFPPGHYDLLRKNCNSFSDCALYFLCEQRLALKYRTMEMFGKLADDHAGVIQSISAGEYTPNPQALGFDMEAILAEIDAERELCDDHAIGSEKKSEVPRIVTSQVHQFRESMLAAGTENEIIFNRYASANGCESSTGDNLGITVTLSPKLTEDDLREMVARCPPCAGGADTIPTQPGDDFQPGASMLASILEGPSGGTGDLQSSNQVALQNSVQLRESRVRLRTWEDLRVPPPSLNMAIHHPVAGPPVIGGPPVVAEAE